MIIHPATLKIVLVNGEEVYQVSSPIEESGRRRPLWFRFPVSAGLTPSTDLDPFVVALVLVAMQRGETLEVRGSLSAKLAASLREYQAIYHRWYPERFRPIEVKADHLRTMPVHRARTNVTTACAFSGGVDSFYTLISLLNTHKPFQAVFMAGFDMPLNLGASIQELTDSYTQLACELGIPFLAGSTNVRQFVNTVDWTNAHGQALGATALFFKDHWDTFLIPSSYTGESYPKWGTHPALDPLLSSETLKFVHHGSELNRVGKLKSITAFPQSHERLRVCWIQDIGLRNCGECEKCLRTMVALEILGCLSDYTTFPRPLPRTRIRNLSQRTYQSRLFSRELIAEALKRGRLRIAADLGASLVKRKWFHLTRRY